MEVYNITRGWGYQVGVTTRSTRGWGIGQWITYAGSPHFWVILKRVDWPNSKLRYVIKRNMLIEQYLFTFREQIGPKANQDISSRRNEYIIFCYGECCDPRLRATRSWDRQQYTTLPEVGVTTRATRGWGIGHRPLNEIWR
jgi:hypothetical protein